MFNLIARVLRKLNPVYQWNIHSSNYNLKAEVRKAIFSHPKLKKLVTYGTYSSPQAGFDGWYDLPGFGCLAFKPTDNDNLRFNW